MYASLVEGSPLDVWRRQCCQGAQGVFPSFAPVREFGFFGARNRNVSTDILGRGVREVQRGWARAFGPRLGSQATVITNAMWISLNDYTLPQPVEDVDWNRRMTEDDGTSVESLVYQALGICSWGRGSTGTRV